MRRGVRGRSRTRVSDRASGLIVAIDLTCPTDVSEGEGLGVAGALVGSRRGQTMPGRPTNTSSPTTRTG
jgi:hypothetical protein